MKRKWLISSIPTHYWEETIAAYRLFDNPKSSFDSIAISTSRVNLSIFDGSMWQREEKSTSRSRESKKITDKESSRWPGVKTVWRGYKKLLNYIEAADALEV